MRRVTTFAQIIRTCEEKNWKLADYFLYQEMDWRQREGEDSSPEAILEKMEINLQVMESAAKEGIGGVQSYSGLTGYDATRLNAYRSETFGRVFIWTRLSTRSQSVNASIGLICARRRPDRNVVPGILLAAREHLKLTGVSGSF